MDLAAVDEFVGLDVTTDPDEPSPGELVARLGRLTELAVRYGHQLPPTHYDTLIKGRDRSYLQLVAHVVGHVGRFVRLTDDPDRDYSDINDFAALGQPSDGVPVADLQLIARRQQDDLVDWWRRAPDVDHPTCTFFGEQTLGWLLVSTAYSVAQHTRQLAALLDDLGIEPVAPIPATDLLGLRLPRGIWDEAPAG